MSIGIPYAEAGVDGYGYYLACPRCGARCRGGRLYADDPPKGAAEAYALHYEGDHCAPDDIECGHQDLTGKDS
jgi:hypothetical protein